jgi:hypothetical protein
MYSFTEIQKSVSLGCFLASLASVRATSRKHLPYLFSAITQRRGFGSFHRQAHGVLTAPAQAERYRVPERVHFTEF